jgi:hypothetical protein
MSRLPCLIGVCINLQAAPARRDVPNDVNVIIEIPARKEIVEPVERYNALPEKPGYW